MEQIKPIAETNQLLIDGKITEIEYKAKVEQLGNGSSSVEGEVIEQKPTSNMSERNKFCSECGTVITEDTKFCGNCGAKIFN